MTTKKNTPAQSPISMFSAKRAALLANAAARPGFDSGSMTDAELRQNELLITMILAETPRKACAARDGAIQLEAAVEHIELVIGGVHSERETDDGEGPTTAAAMRVLRAHMSAICDTAGYKESGYGVPVKRVAA